jgi:hypothetical protein
MAAENEERGYEEEGFGYEMPMHAFSDDHSSEAITPPKASTPSTSEAHTLAADSDGVPLESPFRPQHRRYYSGSSLSGREDTGFLSPVHHAGSPPSR